MGDCNVINLISKTVIFYDLKMFLIVLAFFIYISLKVDGWPSFYGRKGTFGRLVLQQGLGNGPMLGQVRSKVPSGQRVYKPPPTTRHGLGFYNNCGIRGFGTTKKL